MSAVTTTPPTSATRPDSSSLRARLSTPSAWLILVTCVLGLIAMLIPVMLDRKLAEGFPKHLPILYINQLLWLG